MKEKITEADLVLVGIGEEFECMEAIKLSPRYEEIVKELQEQTAFQWILPYIHAYFLKYDSQIEVKMAGQRLAMALQKLQQILEKKNYFIVSTCMNDMLYQSGLREDRMVTPCGGFRNMQCENGCRQSVTAVPETIFKQMEAYIQKKLQLKEIEMPTCPVCGRKMVFNNLYAENYLEEGYLNQWNLYGKWLQGTLNKKLCIIELGVGMQFPSVIRWPFEKTGYFNQKSFFYRVHENLYQITAELAERGEGICKNAVEFLADIS